MEAIDQHSSSSTSGNLPHAAGAVALRPLAGMARRLYELIAGRHDALGYSVLGVPSVTAIGVDGKRRPIGMEPDDNGRDWRPARELVRGGRVVAGERGLLVPRLLTPQTVEAHLRGHYSIAPEAPGWGEWVGIDIDAHAREEDGADGARLAQERARGVLAEVLAALGCGGDRWPLIIRSPGLGFHVWLPLTRGGGGDRHDWPAPWAREWVALHLRARGVELRDGVCEIYPAGRRLRAPLGKGTVLLRVVRPDVRDPLALEPWPGTTRQRVLWSRGGDPQTVRQVGPMVAAFLDEWERQRRTLADWLDRPEAGWDRVWGFLEPRATDAIDGARAKNGGPSITDTCEPSQQVDDVLDPAGGRGARETFERPALRLIQGEGGAGRVGDPDLDLLSPSSFSNSGDVDCPPFTDETGTATGGALLKGRPFFRKVARLLANGVSEASTRHDAVLVLTFVWAAAAGLDDDETIRRLIEWCGSHAHAGSRLSGPRFTATCVREARWYLAHHGPGWRFRGRRGAASPVALGVLTEPDQRIIARVDARVRTEVSTILAFLAGRAGVGGVVAGPVEWCASLAARLLGDRRVTIGKERRRAVVMAWEELARLGVVTLHQGHSVGRHGRKWSCWYRFGSGALPVMVTITRAAWELAGRRDPLVPSLAMLAIVDDRHDAPGDAGAECVELRQVGARTVREGVLLALSDGVGPVRVILEPGRWTPAAARPGYRPAWWLRQFRGQHPPTVGAFEHAHEGAILFGPRAADRVARLARRPRAAAVPLALVAASPAVSAHAAIGGAELGAVGAELRAVAPAGSYDPAAPVQVEHARRVPAGAVERVELAQVRPEIAAVEAPDLAGVLGKAWAAWERRATETGPDGVPS